MGKRLKALKLEHEARVPNRLRRRKGQSGPMGSADGTSNSARSQKGAFDGLLVSWDPSTNASERARTRSELGMTLRESIHTRAMQDNGSGPLEWIDLPRGFTAEQAISKLSRRSGVAYAEKNWVLDPQATSNDTYFTNGSLWGMYGPSSSPANNYGTRAAEAWAAGQTGSASVFVGLIDEGYQYTHADLAANAGTNPGEIAGDGIDNDKNGYIDDVNGWDFDANNNTIYDGTSDDHGTHTAGTIGAQGGNNQGVAGINWNTKLLSAKFIGSTGGTNANAIKAIDYLTALKNKGVNIVATNNSWGGGGYSQAMYDAIDRARQADILFIAAAGNGGADSIGDNNDNTPFYPASYSNSSGGRASFSNYGATTVDIGAPGQAIWSTIPDNSYANYSGTSMAAPHITGAAALLKSIYPNATGLQIKQAILESAASTPSLAGITVSGGRLDIPSAIQRLSAILGSNASLPQIAIQTIDSLSSETGPDPGAVQVSRAGGDIAQDLVVNLLWQGSATNGSDYQAQQATITIPANSPSIDLIITPIDDPTYEGPETLTVQLTASGGYTISPTGSAASLTITDNDTPPPSTDLWGTNSNDTLVGDSAKNTIGGVSRDGTDNGRGTVDTLTGLSEADLFVFADTKRGTFYNDGNAKNQGTTDYALITDFSPSQGDRVQLRANTQYLIRNSGSNTELYLGDGNKTFSASDEFIGILQGVNLSTGTTATILGTTASWVSYV